MWIPTLLPSEATRWLTWQKVGRPSGSRGWDWPSLMTPTPRDYCRVPALCDRHHAANTAHLISTQQGTLEAAHIMSSKARLGNLAAG